jgi:hypothetical protein
MSDLLETHGHGRSLSAASQRRHAPKLQRASHVHDDEDMPPNAVHDFKLKRRMAVLLEIDAPGDCDSEARSQSANKKRR